MEKFYQVIHRALAAALGPAGSPEAPLLRRAYMNPSPPPPEDRDVLYYHLLPDAVPPRTEECFTDGHPCWFRASAWRLMLTFYGPHAASLAWRVWHRLFLDGAGNPRQLLRTQGIFPVPWGPGPDLIWEEWEKQHRPRADLVIRLRIAENLLDSGLSAGTVQEIPPPLIHPSP